MRVERQTYKDFTLVLHHTGPLPFVATNPSLVEYGSSLFSALGRPAVILLDYSDSQAFIAQRPALAEGLWVGLDLPGQTLGGLALPHSVFRYDGSPRPVAGNGIEIALSSTHGDAEGLTGHLNHAGLEVTLAPDVVGLISQRVIALIIAEAHLVERDGIATKDDIDTSMRLGTNYPLGPSEWAALWGVERCLAIWRGLAKENPSRYMYLEDMLASYGK